MAPAASVPTDLVIRPAAEVDLPALNDLYNHYIEHSIITFDLEPNTLEQRRAAWFVHYAATGPYRLLVGERGGALVGYATSSPFRPKAAYGRSVETTVYLDPARRGRGDGGRLYGALLGALAGEPVHRAYAGVALPNEASVRLHRRLGFTEVGIYTEVGFKFGAYVDVAWFERPVP